ncbi:isochorismatase family protein [Streptomyces spinosirectus]
MPTSTGGQNTHTHLRDGMRLEGVAGAPAGGWFTGIELDPRSRQASRRDLVLVGLMAHLCVDSTARDALGWPSSSPS